MKKVTLGIAVLTGLAWVGLGTSEAVAAGPPYGFHFRSGAIHIDVGHVHHGRRGYYGGHNYYGRGHYTGYNRGHYDYHQGSFQRHRNHYHYVPAHYDFHQGSHYGYSGGYHEYYGHRGHYRGY